jgi:hypothetical protein
VPRRAATCALTVAAGVVLSTLAAGCGEEADRPDAPRQACAGVVTDPLDPRSTQHLLPGAPEPAYPSDPPTSGPHLATPELPRGAQSEPVPRPLQVSVLERGGGLIQHRDVAPEQKASLEALAGPDVVVAPAPDLPAPVVATAWRRRLVCTALDVDALKDFVASHRGKVGQEAG